MSEIDFVKKVADTVADSEKYSVCAISDDDLANVSAAGGEISTMDSINSSRDKDKSQEKTL